MSINTDALQVVTGFESYNDFLVNGPAGTGRMSGAEAVAFFDKFFAYALYNYDGVNIKEKFAGEMDFTDPWVWIQQRLAAHDVSGLHIKDCFEATVAGNLLRMRILDINHDLHFGDEEIAGWHIDFGSEDLWPEAHAWNKVTHNNGISTEGSPWLASDLYAWLNSKSMNVPNAATANPATIAVDYSTTGVYDKLPESLKGVIVERRSREPVRYNSGSLLKDDNNWIWKNIGKLWVPDETEVYGQVAWGTHSGYSIGTAHQFPIFMDGKMRIKHLGSGGSRCTWWLRHSSSGYTENVTCVLNDGSASSGSTITATVGAPVCFRISE